MISKKQAKKVLEETSLEEPSQYEVLIQQGKSNMAELERLGLNTPKNLQEEQILVDQLNELRTQKDYLLRDLWVIEDQIAEVSKMLDKKMLKENK